MLLKTEKGRLVSHLIGRRPVIVQGLLCCALDLQPPTNNTMISFNFQLQCQCIRQMPIIIHYLDFMNLYKPYP